MRTGTPRRLNLLGKRFGRLTVIRFSHVSKYGRAYWECECRCENIIITAAAYLNSGTSKSCGCLRNEMTGKRFTGKASRKTHGLSKTKTYGIWCAMLRRCRNPMVPEYKYYGGRGIKVCKKWLSFEKFFQDMKTCPTGYSIERKNNNGDYTPRNCVWIPRNEQQKNRNPFTKKPKKEIEVHL